MPKQCMPCWGSTAPGDGWPWSAERRRSRQQLGQLLPHVGIVAINPPPHLTDSDEVSIVTSGTWPIKTHALRGAVVGLDAQEWQVAALASILPARHLMAEGVPPADLSAKVLATGGGVWVAQAGSA